MNVGLSVLASCVAAIATASAHADDSPVKFTRDIRPLFQSYCFSCHGPDKQKGDINLSTFNDESAIIRDPKTWGAVLEQLNDSTMPPAKKTQPTAAERLKLVTYVHDVMTHIDPATLPKDPGRVTIHRLNRVEYNNTMRDLLGVYTHPADTFPADAGGGGGFDNNADTLFIPPILMERYLNAAGEVLREVPGRKLIATRPDEKLPPRDAAKQTIENFASRAFRRPVTTDEVEKFLRLYDGAAGRGENFDDATRLAMKAILVSPPFLFRIETDRDSKEPYAIGDYELASRLSYFIWSSMPDDELLDLAKRGTLHEDAVLERQARRMLKDPKSVALAENFASQWLGFRKLQTTAQPDRERFPKFTAAVRDAMYDESVLFFDSVFREDRGLLTLIDADYTFLNEALARHYGIPNISGEEMRRVELKDANRGGILCLGSVLTVNSYPLRTSPVLRGRWVLDAVLGTPPPPPPPDVPKIPDDDRAPDGLSIRQRLERHRQDPNCAACHARMDPIGFGLENFDPVGRWRTTAADKPIDSAGVLVSGEAFNGPAELKKVLLGKKDQFAKNVSEKLLAYALGRGIEYYDQPAVQKITGGLARNDDRAGTLVTEIVKSYPFRYRRNSPVAKE
jgi:mono/diheme cytochrome c family protein